MSVRLPIETERLIIRPLELDDAIALHDLYGDPEAMQHLVGDIAKTVDQSREWIAAKIDLHSRTGLSMWAVIAKATGDVVGDAGLQRLGDAGLIEVAARMRRRFWGNGYGREAAEALIRIGFEQLGVERIVGLTAPENVAAQRAMGDIGMRPVGLQRHWERTWVVYEALRPLPS